MSLGKRIVLVLVAIVLLAVVASGAWALYQWNYRRSPEYSVLMMRDAFIKRDFKRFESYVDMEAVARAMILDLNRFTPKNEEMRPDQVVKPFGNEPTRTVEQAFEIVLRRLPTSPGTGRERRVIGSVISELKRDFTVETAVSGEIAYATARFGRPGSRVALDLKMHWAGDRWQAVELMRPTPLQLLGPLLF